MSLWGSLDNANNVPQFVPTDEKSEIFFVSLEESLVAANRAKGLTTPGWVKYTTYTDSSSNTRHKVEVLVPMTVAQATAGDLGSSDPIAATAAVADQEYVIVTAGTTDFTAIGAADSNPGTVFTATGAGTGTGTIRVSEDATVADS